MDVVPREVVAYEAANGNCPFEAWWDSIRDQRSRDILKSRMARIRLGNLGDVRALGNGIHEFKIDIGPGYRIYFGNVGGRVVLLTGGDKKTQKKDVKNSLDYLTDYRRRSIEII